MNRSSVARIIRISAVFVDVAAPLVATLSQFPIWVERSSEATVSGLFLLFAFLSCLPFMKQIARFFKSPSIPMLWLILFAFLVALRNIVDEMVLICFVGMVSNILGMVLFWIANRIYNPNQTKT